MKRLSLIVKGRVQGVGYRAGVHGLVSRLDVTGFVKNLSDGTVQIVAEGAENDLEQVVMLAKEGSAWSRVDDMEISLSDAEGGFSEFSIAY